MADKGIGGHQRAYEGRTDEWLTPPDVKEPLGHFDLDPCSPIDRPWATADKHYTVEDNGLIQDWSNQRVWLNPPYGPETGKWLEKLSLHGNGIALIFARTETDMFFRYGWERADAMLFLRGRLHFYDVNGKRAKHNSGGPSVLIAYGENNAICLRECGLPGQFVQLKVPEPRKVQVIDVSKMSRKEWDDTYKKQMASYVKPHFPDYTGLSGAK